MDHTQAERTLLFQHIAASDEVYRAALRAQSQHKLFFVHNHAAQLQESAQEAADLQLLQRPRHRQVKEELVQLYQAAQVALLVRAAHGDEHEEKLV